MNKIIAYFLLFLFLGTFSVTALNRLQSQQNTTITSLQQQSFSFAQKKTLLSPQNIELSIGITQISIPTLHNYCGVFSQKRICTRM